MSAAKDRKDIVRIDCPNCGGNGFTYDQGRVAADNPEGQKPCKRCGGVGMLEKAMPYRQEGYGLDDAGQIFGVQNPTNRLMKDDPAFDRNPGRRGEEDL